MSVFVARGYIKVEGSHAYNMSTLLSYKMGVWLPKNGGNIL